MPSPPVGLTGASHVRVPIRVGKRRWVSCSGPMGAQEELRVVASGGRRVRRMGGGLGHGPVPPQPGLGLPRGRPMLRWRLRADPPPLPTNAGR